MLRPDHTIVPAKRAIFMTSFSLRAVALSVVLLASMANAKGLMIGVVSPAEGPFALLGKQILEGASAQAEASGNMILAVPETCEAGNGEDVAKRLISGGVDAAIGFLCSDSLVTSLAALGGAGIPAITLSVRSRILFEDAVKHHWPLYSLAPAPGEEAKATADFIAANWAGTPYAILDDGTLNFHELAANIRIELEGKGLAPLVTDNFRPSLAKQRLLAHRLAKAGVTEIYVAGTRNDTAIIARDAAAEATGMTVMGGQSLLAAEEDVPLPAGVLAVMPDMWRNRPEAASIVQALSQKGIIAEGYVLSAYAAALMVEQASEDKKSGQTLGEAIAQGSFTTPIGPVSFGPDHMRKDDGFQVNEWRDGAFQPLKTQ
jgi:branched-chain amino acid transport system substrate-binding protein